MLGSGMSGGVVMAISKASGAKVAVKTLCTEGLRGRPLSQVVAEVENQLMMDHPNICRLLEVFEDLASGGRAGAVRMVDVDVSSGFYFCDCGGLGEPREWQRV